MENKLSLGQAIACIHHAKVSGKILSGLTKSDNAYLDHIRSRLQNSASESKKFQTLVKIGAQTDFTDLFVHMFLNDDFERENLDLLKFFNDSLECFEAYTIVLNDFLQKLEDLSN